MKAKIAGEKRKEEARKNGASGNRTSDDRGNRGGHQVTDRSGSRKTGAAPVKGGGSRQPASRSSSANRSQRGITSYKILSSLFDPARVPQDAADVIRNFDSIVYSTHPLNSKQKVLLPQQVRALSHNLTDERSSRRLGYMNEKTALTAYVHYYMWWNLVRLVKLFSGMEESAFCLKDGDICADIGSGPLTVVTALLLARPELRNKKLTWYCVDLSHDALAFGEDIFLSVAARLGAEPWKIIRVKGSVDSQLKEKCAFVTSANVFNELHDDADMPPDFLAKSYTGKILSFADGTNPDARVLTIEPGDPRSARLVSLMRDAYMRRGFVPVAPCCHCRGCPMDGKKGGKWCNFAFSTDDAPAGLKKISEKADLAKERAVLSFVLARRGAADGTEMVGKTDAGVDGAAGSTDATLLLRIASDPIRLPGNRTGYYACSDMGLVLFVTEKKLFSGQLIEAKRPDGKRELALDEKSGAILMGGD